MRGGAELARRPIRWIREHTLAADSILAAIVTAMALFLHSATNRIESDQTFHTPTWWTVALIILATAPIAVRRRAPVWALGLVLGGQLACEFWDVFGPSWLAVIIAVYSLGAHTEGQRRTYACAGALAVVLIAGTVAIITSELDPIDVVPAIGILTAAFVIGDNLRRRRDHLESLADRAERAERERDLLARERVAEERNRIARELHDIVAHSVSVMVIQASAARRNLAGRPDQATALLENVERTGRQTMDELRQVLGVLRADAGQAVAAVPLPTLDDLAALVEGGEVGGVGTLRTELTITGDRQHVPAGVAVSVYRIVQEALTNAHRHAGPGATVRVEVTCGTSDVTIVVSDDGRGASSAEGRGGYGLIGMRERATAAGGSFRAGPRRGGGWSVTATIPFQATTDAPDATTTLVS
jgi:signal transduction histidine kinase